LRKLGCVPAVAEAQNGSTSREVVKVGSQSRREDGWSIPRAKDDGAEADTGGLNRERSEMQPGFWGVGRVVTEEERIEFEGIGQAPCLHVPLGRVQIIGAGKSLESPTDQITKLSNPGMTADQIHRFLRISPADRFFEKMIGRGKSRMFLA
jgi:hypothetical protein